MIGFLVNGENVFLDARKMEKNSLSFLSYFSTFPQNISACLLHIANDSHNSNNHSSSSRKKNNNMTRIKRAVE